MKRIISLITVLFIAIPLAAQKPADWKEPKHIASILTTEGQEAGLPIALPHCVAYTESRFIPTARSRVVDGYRSCGLMQLYRRYLYGNASLSRRFGSNPATFQWDDPEQNAEVGCRYLSWLIQRYGGSVWLALIAYNWGPTNLSSVRSLDEIPPDVIDYANGILALCDEWSPEWAEGGK